MDIDLGDEIQVRIEKVDGRKVVYVEGELALPAAGGLRLVLMEAMKAGQATVLDASGVTALDLCGLQLLCSAHRTYRRNGASLELRAEPPEVREIAQAAGFQGGGSACACPGDGRCLWRR
jgi:anti-anti-sigma factor